MSLASVSTREIQLLGMSPAFAMSLGAKELFHTNFLAFLLESDDAGLAEMQLAIRRALGFPRSQGAASRCAVWREKNNLDLIVVELHPVLPDSGIREDNQAPRKRAGKHADAASAVWDWSLQEKWQYSTVAASVGPAPGDPANDTLLIPTGKTLIVEAKLKSIPQLQQLEEYDTQLSRRAIALKYPEDSTVPEWRLSIGGAGTTAIERRLLSVAGITMTTSDEKQQPRHVWTGVTWKRLHEEMVAATRTLGGSPLQATVTDYIEVLGALVVLLDRVHRMCEDARTSAGNVPTYGAMRMQSLHPHFRALRISDLMGKTLFDYWRVAFMSAAVLPKLPDGWSRNSYVNYSNGVPGFGVELVNNEFRTPCDGPIGLKIGIQIQNCEFRIFVDVDRDWAGLESWVAAHPVLLSEWYRNPVFATPPVGVRGAEVARLHGTGRATNLKVFGINRFLYSKVDIDDIAVTEVERELEKMIRRASALLDHL